mmetsp:Transcript_138916/g.241568  ORF Transcript_138916/g.241568 Transcript_138916/m.241568 type:complete len:176 (-) Transcript_138916:310-837(-)
METRDATNVINFLKRRLFELRYPKGQNCRWAMGDHVCAVFNQVETAGEKRYLYNGRVINVTGRRVLVHWSFDKTEISFDMDDVHATSEAAFAACQKGDLQRQAEVKPAVRTRASVQLKAEKKEIVAQDASAMKTLACAKVNIEIKEIVAEHTAAMKTWTSVSFGHENAVICAGAG